MDYATKFIAIALVSFTIYCVVFQTDLITSIFDSIVKILSSIIEPVKNLLGSIF